jgi:peptidoglycan/LPS O-acetylase OafA/YrhL
VAFPLEGCRGRAVTAASRESLNIGPQLMASLGQPDSAGSVPTRVGEAVALAGGLMSHTGVGQLTEGHPVAGVPAPGSHIPALDGVRGLAVLLVMLCHFTSVGLPPTSVGNYIHTALNAGWSGVDLFFVLSGFLITGILYDAKQSSRYFRTFYIRRFLRIFPLYYGCLIVFFWVVPLIHPFTPAMERVAARQGWLWGYAANLVMAWDRRWIFEADWMVLGHFWTLAIEEQFYLLWPFIVFLLPRPALMRVCIGCMLAAFAIRTTLVLHHAHPITVGMLTFCRFDSLAVGGLAALIIRGDQRRSFGSIRFSTIGVGAALCVLALLHGWKADDPLVQTLGFSVLGLFCAGLLVLVVEQRQGNKLQRWFSSPVLMWFGTYSYAMYVFHVALRPLFDWIAPVKTVSLYLHSEYLGVAVYVLVAMSGTAGVAYASWHLYEKHFLKLKRRFAPGPIMRAPDPSLTGAIDPNVAVAVARPGRQPARI